MSITELLEPSRGNLKRLAETAANEGLDGDEVPGRVRLCFRAMEPAVAGEALLASGQPLVRSWALHMLRQLRQAKTMTDAAASKTEAVLWSALRDPAAGLRLEAARALLAGSTATEEFVQKLALAMGAANIDEAVQAALSLRSAGVADDLARRVAGRLEGERPESCPVCQEKIAQAQRLDHLRSVHGYVEMDGVALPRPEALSRLWDRVLQEGSQPAHEQLLKMLDLEPAAYVAALEDALAHQPPGPKSAPPQQSASLDRLVRCLQQTDRVLPIMPHLLQVKDQRLREVGRAVLLPHLGKQLGARPVHFRDHSQAAR